MSYCMNHDGKEYKLKTTVSERDLGVIISSDLKWHDQVTSATAKAQRTLGLIKRTFTYFDVEMVKSLYTTFVRPLLEFAIPAWQPYLQRDIDELEKVQRRATKLVPQLKKISYEKRLKAMGLTTLEKRRARGDLIQQYRFKQNIDQINWYKNPKPASSVTSSGPAFSEEFFPDLVKRIKSKEGPVKKALDPDKANEIRKNMSMHEPVKMKVEDALSLKIQCDLSDEQYQIIRNSSLLQNANIYPSLHKILTEKKKCYPDNMIFSETSAVCSLQSLFNHTV
nr:uncharacterized protein LOC105845965 [Hydra vulgaris]